MAKYRVIYSPGSRRSLAKMPPKIIDVVVAFCEGPMAENPQRVGKPLKDELDGLMTARRGAYRILYRIYKDEVIVMVAKIEHRAHVYRA